ncbi:MAG: hypothetical protein ABH804_02790 [archaeon]
MIEVLGLAWYGSYGGIGTILSQWEQAGFFSYLLPFLLLFALVFGLLEKTKIFEQNKFINGIIALVVGLMALQFNIVSRFFSEIFPRFGVGLAILLIVMIVFGIFTPKATWATYSFFGIGAVILAVVLIQTGGAVGWSAGYWWKDNWPIIVGAVFILVLIGVIVGASSPKQSTFVDSPFMKSLFGTEKN